jgi:uncharacterized protein (UPF0335 family)
MSNVLNHIEENPQETKQLIGMEYEQLQQLIQNVERLHNEKRAALESEKIRIIAGGGGRKPKLSVKEQIILTLQKFKGDLGYQGEDVITTPIKKPRNRELTTEQKSQNKEFSGKRIFVEHRIRSVKIFRVVQERFRLNPQKYEQVILTICGLVRFRIGALILSPDMHAIAAR